MPLNQKRLPHESTPGEKNDWPQRHKDPQIEKYEAYPFNPSSAVNFFAAMKFLSNRLLLLALRLVIGGIFIYAGTLKIADPVAFADSIATFQILPSQLINVVALALPLFEILAGGALIFGLFWKQAAFALLNLTLAFAFFLIQAIVRGLQIDCGCFGSGEPSEWSAWFSLGRDILLMAGVAVLYFLGFKGENGCSDSR